MYSIELRVALDRATQGGLYALNCVSKKGLDPHVWLQPKAIQGFTRVIFYATDATGKVKYFDTALTPRNEVFDLQVLMAERMREVQKRTAQIREGLARLDAGLDPDYEKPDRSRN
jgi:hypothetical protein